jgi:hypothetical protein
VQLRMLALERWMGVVLGEGVNGDEERKKVMRGLNLKLRIV